MSKILIGFVVVVLLLGGMFFAFTGFFAFEEETIKIGAILPLTGAAHEGGNRIQEGMLFAIQEINDAGSFSAKEDLGYLKTQSFPAVTSSDVANSMNITTSSSSAKGPIADQ